MIMTRERILITGATGFIGRHLAVRLSADGYQVGALVRHPSTPLPDFSHTITLLSGDIRNFDDLSAAFASFKPDVVIHLVTYYAVMHRADEIGVMLDTNVKGTVNLLEASKESGTVKLFINTSTCAIYKEMSRPLKEDDEILPQNLYAMTKLQAEEACDYYAGEFHVPCVTLRLFPPYGPGDHERRLIPYVIGSILNNSPPNLTTGKQEWDFVYIDDIVSAYLAILKAYPFKERHTIYNIGTGQAVSVSTVVEKIRDSIGSDICLPWGSVPHRSHEVWFNSADISKADKEIAWKPVISIDDGLVKTIKWFRKYYSKKSV